MNTELFVRVAFACMACDGEIDSMEIDCIKQVFKEMNLDELDTVSVLLNDFTVQLNTDSNLFFSNLFLELSQTELTEIEEIEMVSIALKIIEADNIVDYEEVKLLKKIRSYLKISDASLLEVMPDKEDFIVQDVKSNIDFLRDFNLNISISEIKL